MKEMKGIGKNWNLRQKREAIFGRELEKEKEEEDRQKKLA
jgi:hypothetical protein